MASFKAEVRVFGETSFNGNALRFATREQADVYARDLSMRWLAVEDWRVVEVPDEPNYQIVEGVLSRL